MTMTRQHFEMIAAVVKTIEDPATRTLVAVKFCDELAKTNPNFRATQFPKACGWEE